MKRQVMLTIDPDDFELVKAAAYSDRYVSVNKWICDCIVMVAKSMNVQPLSGGPTLMGKPIEAADDGGKSDE